MKKSLLYMAAAAVVSLGFTACSPEEFEGADSNARPTMDGVDFNPAVDQETNTMIVQFAEKEGCYPVWNVRRINADGSKESVKWTSLPVADYQNNEAGNYEIELRLANRNGFSDRSITKTFKFDKDLVDYSPIFKRLCAKEWRVDYSEKGHMGCGEPNTDGSNWWAAGPEEKKDWGVYDDRISFSDPGLKGGTYTYNPGEGGTVYCNKDVHYPALDSYNTNDDTDYMATVQAQTSTFTIETDTWNGDKVNFLVFPEGTYLPYVPNDDAVTTNNRWRIEALTATRLVLVNDNGGISWRLVFTTKDEVKAFEGFNYGAESNMWLGVDNGSMPYEFHYYYAPGWNPIADPVCTHDGAEWNWVLPEATSDQWQAQCPIKPAGLHLTTSKTYDFSCIINSNVDLPGVTVKLTSVETGDNYVFVERVPVEAGKDYIFYVSDVNSLSADADCELFFDFGGNPANADITVRNITLKDHAIDDGTVLPSDEPGDQPGGEQATMDWDPASAANLWAPVESGEAFISVTPWFADNGWGQIADPTWSHENGVWTVVLPEGMGGSQWQGQFPINTTLTASQAKKYNFYCVVEADADCPGVTIKLTETDDAEKHDDNYFTADRHDLKADVPYVFKCEAAQLPKNDAHALSLFFDFGGSPVGTTVKISKIYFEEATVLSYDDPGNLWRSVDEGTAFLSVTPWFADNGWGQIGDPAWSHNGNEWSLIIPEGMGGSQWQGQFPINTSLTAKGDKAYNFSCTLEADEDLPGVTIKLTQTDEADGTKHDDNFFFADRHDVKADVPFKYTMKGVKLAKGTDAHALSLFFDFGGSPIGANIKIKDIIFEEAE